MDAGDAGHKWRKAAGVGRTGVGGSGPGQHLGSRYVFSHVKEVVVAAHVLGGERAREQF